MPHRALDDFGTGYSSLYHLKSLPFDELKVDRTFVSSMAAQRASRKIVDAVVGLGQSLGLNTIAEGIETQQQADMLLRLGCDMGQGWHYGRPVPAEQLPSIVELRQARAISHTGYESKLISVDCREGLPSQRLAQLQAMYDGAPVGLAFLDCNLKYVNINRRLAEMHGLSIEDHYGKTLAEVIPELYPFLDPHVKGALNGHGTCDLEIREPSSRGRRRRTFLVSYQPAFDEAGEVVGVSCAVKDFTNNVADAIPRIHPADRPFVESAIRKVISREMDEYAAQYRVLRPDGSVCWIDARGVMMGDGSQRMIGIGMDVTEDTERLEGSKRMPCPQYQANDSKSALV